jgi:heme exporter protein A
VEKYSTGMKRRVALARLLLDQAPIWLLDEPCNGIDDHGRTVFTGILKQHLAQGGTAAVITHDSTILEGLAVTELSLDRKEPHRAHG